MEKDYFLDRTSHAGRRECIIPGKKAFICTKEAQSYAKELKDLNLVTINKVLTPIDYHPRGIKVMGTETLEGADGDYEVVRRYGRVVYPLSGEYGVETKEGFKLIVKDQEGFHLVKKKEMEEFYILMVWLGAMEYTFAFPLDDFTYWKKEEEATRRAQEAILDTFLLDRNGINFNKDGKKRRAFDLKAYYKEKEITIHQAFLDIRKTLSIEGQASGSEFSLPLSLVGFSIETVSDKIKTD